MLGFSERLALVLCHLNIAKQFRFEWITELANHRHIDRQSISLAIVDLFKIKNVTITRNQMPSMCCYTAILSTHPSPVRLPMIHELYSTDSQIVYGELRVPLTHTC